MALLVTDALRWWTRALPDRVALVCGDEEVRYGHLGEWTDRVATDLVTRHGIVPGDVIGIAGTNSLEWCIAALASVKAGAIVTPINFRYTVPEVAYLVEDSAPTLVFADAGETSKLQAVQEQGHRFTLLPMTSVRDHEGGAPSPIRVEMDPADPVVLAYTSGTTGRPKGLVYTHQTVLNALYELLLKDPTPPEETNLLLALPLFSVAGIMHTLLHMTSRGAKSVVMKDMDPAAALQLLVAHRISHMNGVPIIWERMAAQPGFEQLDLSHMKVAMVGGARVSTELTAAWHARGVALRHMYGMTEVGGCGTVPRPDDALAHPELCGDGSIFTEIKTVRKDGTDCAPGEEGEILMRGPAMMVRYWNNPEATAAVMGDGWIHSGDVGIIDEHGYVRFVDRLKDIIISGGFNVSPTEVENVIGKVPGVLEVAVIAVPDKEWGETPAAIIHASGDVDPAAILEAAKAELAVFKVPRYVVQAPGPLPRMASGKLAKRQLREDYADLPESGTRL